MLIAPIATGCAALIGLDEPEFSPPAGDGGLDALQADACVGANLATGAESCGRQPELITQGHGKILSIAVDEEAVYFNSSDKWILGRAKKNGGGAVTYLLPEGGLKEPTTGLVVDGPYLYASAYSSGAGAGARRLLKDGGSDAAEKIDTCNTGWSLTLDATNVYWITGDCGGLPRLRRRPKDERDAAARVTSATDDIAKYGFAQYGYQAIDETDVYWVNKPEIRALSKSYVADASSRVVFEAGAGTAEVFRSIAVADRIYAMQGGRIIAVPKNGGEPEVIADGFPPGQKSHAGLLVEDGILYFTVPDIGLVARVPTTGGKPETLASNQKTPIGLALDEKYVYWSTAGDGSIWRITR